MPLMPRSKSSVAVSTAVMASQEEPVQPTYRGYGTFASQHPAQRQRRHSWHTRPCMQEAENFQVLVCNSAYMRMGKSANYVSQLRNFLAELNCRLDLLEDYGHLKYDAGVEYAY